MSKLLVVDEHHYYRSNDGHVWIPSQNDYKFWERYLQVFDSIKVVSRIKDVSEKPDNMLLSSGPRVEFVSIPDYVGPYQYARSLLRIRRVLKQVHQDCTHAIFRLPSELSFNLFSDYMHSNKPFGVEVLIDPWDAMAPGVTKSLVRPYVRLRWHKLTQKMCMNANGVAYVTERMLQKRYPCRAMYENNEPKYFTTHYSSIHLDKSFLQCNEVIDKDEFVITHVGTMQNFIKGQDVLLKAMKLVLDEGFKIKIVLVGDGILRGYYENLAKELEIEKNVTFTGHLPGSESVREYLLKSDLFVYPTKAEGLPRVIIEAMACSVPVISSPVNGVPELITEDLLVDYNDFEAFARKTIMLLQDKNKRIEIGRRNFDKAHEYTADVLQERRRNFYNKLEKLSTRG